MIRARLLRKLMVWMTLIGMGGTTFQLSGCDQDIRSGVIEGLNGAADTLILALTEALFTSLENSGTPDELTGGLTDTGGT